MSIISDTVITVSSEEVCELYCTKVQTIVMLLASNGWDDFEDISCMAVANS